MVDTFVVDRDEPRSDGDVQPSVASAPTCVAPDTPHESLTSKKIHHQAFTAEASAAAMEDGQHVISRAREAMCGMYDYWWANTQHVLDVLPHIKVARLILIPPLPCPAQADHHFLEWVQSALRVEENATTFVLQQGTMLATQRENSLDKNRVLARLQRARWSIDTTTQAVFESGIVGVQVTFRLLALKPSSDERKAERQARALKAQGGCSAAALRPLTSRIHGIACHRCHHPIVSYAPPFNLQSVKAMPSDHWQEVLECWVCHTEEHDLQKVPQHGIEARSSELLVGETYWLVRKDRPEGTEPDRYACSGCQTLLGQWDPAFPSTSIRLNKRHTDLLLLASQGEGRIDRRSISVLTTLTQLILSAMEAHATTRFVLSSSLVVKESLEPAIRLWILNTDVAFHSSFHSKEKARGEQHDALPIMKLLYSIDESVSSSRETEDSLSPSDSWTQAESFTFFSDEDLKQIRLYFEDIDTHFGTLNQTANPQLAQQKMKVAWLPL